MHRFMQQIQLLLFDDALPEPRDVLLLGLAQATGALGRVLTEEELERCAPRIASLVALEEINRSVGVICNEIWQAVITATATYPH